MASIIKADNGVSSGVTGIVQTADSSGQLALQTTTSGGTATTAVTIDNSQNVGVGVSTSSWGTTSTLYVGGNIVAIAGGGFTSNLYYSSGWKYAGTGYGMASYPGGTGGITWQIAGNNSSGAGASATLTQAMTLDTSGNLLVGQTSHGFVNANSFEASPPNGGYTIGNHASGSTSGTAYAYFAYNAGSIGSITQNGTTGVLYNLTSDYRLKNNPVPVTGAKDFVMALQPKTWDWWDGSGKGVGFIAHEFMEVAKYSGHGEKDAVDADGKPVYQSIQPSSSEVMANLVAYIQELSAEVTDLKAKLGV